MREATRTDLFAEARRSFEAAAHAEGVYERTASIAGGRVAMRFAGDTIERTLFRAFAHLESAGDGVPGMTIHVWDPTASGGSVPPPLPEATDGLRPRYLLRTADKAAVAQPGEGFVSLLDRPRREAFHWLTDRDRIPSYERGTPFRSLLNWWLAGRGGGFVHAGAVGDERGGVLLGGRGGSGKTTAALVCLRAGMKYVSDDYVAAGAGPVPVAWGLFGSAKLEPEHSHRFPELAATALPPADWEVGAKVIVFPNEAFPEQVVDSLPVRAVVLPRVVGEGATTVRPVSRAAALAALAPSTVLQLPGAGDTELQAIGRLIREVPSFVMEIGEDMDAIPAVVSTVLEEAS